MKILITNCGKAIKLLLCLFSICSILGFVCNKPITAYVESPAVPIEGQYHGWDIDNWLPFMYYLESLGYDLDEVQSFTFVQDYTQEYYDAMDLGILVPLDNDVLFSGMLIQPLWSSEKDYQKYKTDDTHQVIANRVYEYIQPLYPNLFGTIPSDRSNNSSNGSGTDWANLVWYAAWPDKEEDVNSNSSHFYYPINGGNLFNNSYQNAKQRFTGHYNDAVSYFNNNNKTEAFRSLGKALHYISDMATPVHTGYQAANLIEAGWLAVWEHVPFENSAKDIQATAFNGYSLTSNLWNGSLDSFVGDVAWTSNSLYPNAKSSDATTRENTARTAMRNAADACASVLVQFADDIGHKRNGLIIQNNIVTGYNPILSSNVTVPDGVTAISNSAFANCPQLSQISIPSSVTSIGSSAFKNCAGLTNIILPNNLTSIGACAFEGCINLNEIPVPSSVTQISKDAFYKTNNIPIYIDGRVSVPSNFDANWNSSGNPVYLNGSLCTHNSGTTLIKLNDALHGYLCNKCRTITSKVGHTARGPYIPLYGMNKHYASCICGTIIVSCIGFAPPGQQAYCYYCGQPTDNVLNRVFDDLINYLEEHSHTCCDH